MNRIPKIIHYFWFGDNEFPDWAKRNIKTWKEKLPDYEIYFWNEENYNIEKSLYLKQAYEVKKFAFVADYARIDILNQYGGIYMDVDVEVIKNLDEFLENDLFGGFENKKGGVNPGIIFGSIKNHYILSEILELYNKPFIKENGELDLTTIVHNTTEVLKRHGLIENGKKQTFDNITIYPKVFFAPDISRKNYRDRINENTYSIHHYAASWVDKEVINRKKKIHWKIITKICVLSSKIGKKMIGEEKWGKFRNKFFKRIYNKITTVK